ncbi:MAG TPA: MlaD family protein [Syntrophorhabdales bacterium]|nr:MlaD family protein [Syntrophorhabdales bacterium]
MSKPVNKTVIGIFVVVALALVVAAVLIVGSGRFFSNNLKFVMYFQRSVKGLAIGSPVNFRGVKVGSVTAIRMLFNPKDLSITIPVYVELESGLLEELDAGASGGGYKKARNVRYFAEELIMQGLRAQLEMQSVVTGQLQIALDFYPDKLATFVGADHKAQEIPTIPTPLQELAKRVEKIPVEEIFEKMNAAMTGLEKIMTSPETAEMLRSVKKAVEETRDLVQAVDKQVEPLAKSMVALANDAEELTEKLHEQVGPLTASLIKTSDEAGVTLKEMRTAVSNIQGMTGEDSVFSYNLVKTLDELRAAARSMRLMTDTFQHQPEAVIFGKKNTKEETR